MRKHRLVHVLLWFTVFLAIFGLRLLWISVIANITASGGSASPVAAKSVRQRQVFVRLDDGRGTFTDRYFTPLTGEPMKGLLLLPGGAGELNEARLTRIAEVLEVSKEKVVAAWPRIGEPPRWWSSPEVPDRAESLTAEQAASLASLVQSSAVVAERTVRYSDERLAAHLVGVVSQHPERIQAMYPDKLADGRLRLSTPVGSTGLELAFDRFLLGYDGKYLSYYTDGRGMPLKGIGLRLITPEHPYYPLSAVTTIDASLQRSVEKLADRLEMKEGAVVVLDMETADVVALISRPDEDPRNRALAAIPPGSVMKTFLAAVALEEKVVSPEETFHCDGTYPKYGLTCWKESGHGKLTFSEALAQSCNVVFAAVGERLDGETLQRYAESMGVSGKVGWSGISLVDDAPLMQWPEEEASRLFVTEAAEADGGMLAQTAIGQRDVRMTPLAAANWMVTLYNGGKLASPRAVSELRFADGRVFERYAVQVAGKKRLLSPFTVRALREMMEDVAVRGTGKELAAAKWKVAGKSGTAEDRQRGKDTVHQWFVGYAPAHRPRYTAAVVFMNRPPDSKHLAAAFFKELVNLLADRQLIHSESPRNF